MRASRANPLRITSYNRFAAVGALALIVATVTLAIYGHGKSAGAVGRAQIVGVALTVLAAYAVGLLVVEALLARYRLLGIVAGTLFSLGCAAGVLLALTEGPRLRGPSEVAYLEAAFGLGCGWAVATTWVTRALPRAMFDGLFAVALTIGLLVMAATTLAPLVPSLRSLDDGRDQVNPAWRVILGIYTGCALCLGGGLRRWPRTVFAIVALFAFLGVLLAFTVAAFSAETSRPFALAWAAGLGLTSAALGARLVRWALDLPAPKSFEDPGYQRLLASRDAAAATSDDDAPRLRVDDDGLLHCDGRTYEFITGYGPDFVTLELVDVTDRRASRELLFAIKGEGRPIGFLGVANRGKSTHENHYLPLEVVDHFMSVARELRDEDE